MAWALAWTESSESGLPILVRTRPGWISKAVMSGSSTDIFRQMAFSAVLDARYMYVLPLLLLVMDARPLVIATNFLDVVFRKLPTNNPAISAGAIELIQNDSSQAAISISVIFM